MLGSENQRANDIRDLLIQRRLQLDYIPSNQYTPLYSSVKEWIYYNLGRGISPVEKIEEDLETIAALTLGVLTLPFLLTLVALQKIQTNQGETIINIIERDNCKQFRR